MDDRYGTDVLAVGWRTSGRVAAQPTPAVRDLVVEVAADGFCGAVTRTEPGFVELEDRHGRRRLFPLGGGYRIEGTPVVLVAPAARQTRTASPAAPRRTASGSFAVEAGRARVALPSRILVEGRHDAELVEKVWGDDLRVEGVAVEELAGVDLLVERLRDDPPGPARRYGVLVDHLVAGSKEARIAAGVARSPYGPHVLVVGHPHLDVWQCILPAVVGIPRWPDVPRGVDVKVGTCRALGWPAETPADLARAWRRILGAVRSYRDLDPALLGRIEELIDFVTMTSDVVAVP